VGTPATVLEALRRFIPELRTTAPALSPHQHRAIRAITRCRTPALGGRAFACKACHHVHFAYHSCNHKACPQCGALSAHRWVRRELRKLIQAPYFMVTFTLPAQLRSGFFGPHAKEAYDLFFTAASGALSEKLAADKGLRAHTHGFVAVLHTWTQRLEFHPHIHCLVPGAGLNQQGQFVKVKNPNYLLYLLHLQAAFRQRMYRLLKEHHWQPDPEVWRKTWGVHIQPAGAGASALNYLSAYVSRTAITNARMVRVDESSVTFRWKDRGHNNKTRLMTLPGVEFTARYLRHVLPAGLRSIRYYGFCHPAAKASRMRVQLHSGRAVELGNTQSILPDDLTEPGCPPCPRCGQATQLVFTLARWHSERGPPAMPTQLPSSSLAAA
jgi:hypothetical protein